MIQKFDLTMIDANPYQPREREDPEHVKKIALSIAAEGLMQVPVGRLVEERVQLAFGHTRLAAFKWLHDLRNNSNIQGDYSQMPVDIRELDDEQMFRQGISENLARKDLTAIEEAKAMLRYREDFKKTSEQIGELFGLSDSAVRNKIRLLELPAGIQEQLSKSPISELSMRELLTLFDLPEILRLNSDSQPYYQEYHTDTIVREALEGKPAEFVHNKITSLVERHTEDMSAALWKFEMDFPGNENIVGKCKGCPYLVVREKKNRCAMKSCYHAKERAIIQAYLEEASHACGIPLNDDLTLAHYQANTFGWGDEAKKQFQVARDAHCENLRLIFYDTGVKDSREAGQITEFPKAFAICQKRRGFCTCRNAMDAGIDLSARVTVQPAGNNGTADLPNEQPAPLTAETLKTIARDARAQEKENRRKVVFLWKQSAAVLAQGVIGGNSVVLRKLLRLLGNWVVEDSPEKYPDEELLLDIGQKIAEAIYSHEAVDPNPTRALDAYNDFLRKAGLSEVFIPRGQDEPEPEQPKTLAQVFTQSENKCPKCGQPMQREIQDDGWAWLHCVPCDQYQPEEA